MWLSALRCHVLAWLSLTRGHALNQLHKAVLADAEPGRLHLLQAASPLPLHSHPGQAARASLDFSGLATLEFEVEKIHDHRLKGKLLEQAAMQAAALAVAEETAAAKAASGGEASSARFLASARLKHMRDRVHRGDQVSALSSRFEVVNESHANGSHANNASVPAGTKSKEGINPFNPFTNPFFNPFTPNPYTPMHSGGGFKGNVLFILFLAVLAVSFCAITFGGIMDDDEDSSGDDSSFGYLNRLDMDGARRGREKMAKKLTKDENKRNCSSCFSCLGCRCPTTVVIFSIVAVFVTVLGGKILWSCGILQPLLAQLLLYAYVILIIFGFVAVITHELTRKVRKMIGGIYQNLSDVTEVMPGFMRKKGNASPMPARDSHCIVVILSDCTPGSWR